MLFYFIMSLLGVVIFCVGMFIIANLVCHLENKKHTKKAIFALVLLVIGLVLIAVFDQGMPISEMIKSIS